MEALPPPKHGSLPWDWEGSREHGDEQESSRLGEGLLLCAPWLEFDVPPRISIGEELTGSWLLPPVLWVQLLLPSVPFAAPLKSGCFRRLEAVTPSLRHSWTKLLAAGGRKLASEFGRLEEEPRRRHASRDKARTSLDCFLSVFGFEAEVEAEVGAEQPKPTQ